MSPLAELAAVFARVSLFAFGGGLGILPEMERQTVTLHSWVTHREFVDAWALSQVTPGPGMLMVRVIGFRAAGLGGARAARKPITSTISMPGPGVTWDRAQASTNSR